jgi:hypothetical protein
MYDTVSGIMPRNPDGAMGNLCNRLMASEQEALNTQTYILEDMAVILEHNPGREDIAACIQEIKSKIKADEAQHWAIANHWGEHFDGIAPGGADKDGD